MRKRAPPPFGRRRFLLFAFVVEYDLGFEKVIVIRADLDLLPFRLAARIIDGRKAAATIERKIADGSDGVGDDDACQADAFIERAICNDFCSFFDGIFAGKRGFGCDQILPNGKDVVFPIVLIIVICGTGECFIPMEVTESGIVMLVRLLQS